MWVEQPAAPRLGHRSLQGSRESRSTVPGEDVGFTSQVVRRMQTSGRRACWPGGKDKGNSVDRPLPDRGVSTRSLQRDGPNRCRAMTGALIDLPDEASGLCWQQIDHPTTKTGSENS